MKSVLQTAILAGFMILITASFSFAQASAGSGAEFPFFHLGCLIIGGLIILSLKSKYEKLYLSEGIGAFALYAFLVALFTAPVADALKNMIN
jgi:hypothetical protein